MRRDTAVSRVKVELFTLKMGMIQTGLLVRFGHRPLNKFPLKGSRKNIKRDVNHLDKKSHQSFPHICSISASRNETDDEDDDGSWVLESSTAVWM